MRHETKNVMFYAIYYVYVCLIYKIYFLIIPQSYTELRSCCKRIVEREKESGEKGCVCVCVGGCRKEREMRKEKTKK